MYIHGQFDQNQTAGTGRKGRKTTTAFTKTHAYSTNRIQNLLYCAWPICISNWGGLWPQPLFVAYMITVKMLERSLEGMRSAGTSTKIDAWRPKDMKTAGLGRFDIAICIFSLAKARWAMNFFWQRAERGPVVSVSLCVCLSICPPPLISRQTLNGFTRGLFVRQIAEFVENLFWLIS